MEAEVGLSGERAVRGLALHQDDPVEHHPRGRVPQLDLPIDACVDLAGALMPHEAHLQHTALDEGDALLTDDGALRDLLWHADATNTTRRPGTNYISVTWGTTSVCGCI